MVDIARAVRSVVFGSLVLLLRACFGDRGRTRRQCVARATIGLVRALASLLLSLSLACSSASEPVTPATPSAPAARPPTTVSASPASSAQPAPPASDRSSALRVRSEGFDLRATFWQAPLFVLTRGHAAAPSGPGESMDDDREMDVLIRWPLGPASGDPVRVVGEHGTCDGTLGARYRIEAPWLDSESPNRAGVANEVVGCPGPALFAIVHPTPDAPWPELLAEGEPAARAAIEAARRAASALAPGARSEAFDASAYRLEGDVYAVAVGPRCDDGDEAEGCVVAGTAVVVVEPGQAARTLIVRPVHFPWDEPTDADYTTCGVLDVDGDGAIELCERMYSVQRAMIRLVRPGAHRAGEVVWRLEEDFEYDLPTAAPAPAPAPIETPPPGAGP